jgi:hypothetical protein
MLVTIKIDTIATVKMPILNAYFLFFLMRLESRIMLDATKIASKIARIGAAGGLNRRLGMGDTKLLGAPWRNGDSGAHKRPPSHLQASMPIITESSPPRVIARKSAASVNRSIIPPTLRLAACVLIGNARPATMARNMVTPRARKKASACTIWRWSEYT